MKKVIVAAFIVFLVVTSQISAATFTDNFDNGISVSSWQIIQTDAAGAPWTVTASDLQGGVQIFKAPDNSARNVILKAGLQSKFLIDGDFSVSVDFDLLSFPLSNSTGWNMAILEVFNINTAFNFKSLRFDTTLYQNAEAFTDSIEPIQPGGIIADDTMKGRFIISRTGRTMSAWIYRGYGDNVLLGSLANPNFLGPMKIQFYAAQAGNDFYVRPTTGINVRYDNFKATAESIIIPEPCSLALLGIGGLLVRRRKK